MTWGDGQAGPYARKYLPPPPYEAQEHSQTKPTLDDSQVMGNPHAEHIYAVAGQDHGPESFQIGEIGMGGYSATDAVTDFGGTSPADQWPPPRLQSDAESLSGGLALGVTNFPDAQSMTSEGEGQPSSVGEDQYVLANPQRSLEDPLETEAENSCYMEVLPNQDQSTEL